MSDIGTVIDRYIASWNERDPQRRRSAIEKVWTEQGNYTDPMAVARGRAEIEATIAAVQHRFPDCSFRLHGPVDAHHDIARFGWALGPATGEPVVIGFDVAVLDQQGRISDVHGFLDPIPA